MAYLQRTAGLLALALALPVAAQAGPGGGRHDHHDHHHGQGEPHPPGHARHGVVGLPQAVSLRLPDTPLMDQDGRPRRLVSDVIGDKVVVASFVYTSCTTVCPVVSALFSQVQDRLGALLEDRVRLVSLSVDPVRDTPARLREYASRHGARPGWIWLTGSGGDVEAALMAFGTYTPDFRDHPATLLVGDGRTGRWTRFYGFESPDNLVARVRDYLEARERVGLAERE